MSRRYWIACGLLIGTGLLGVVLVCLFPPEHFDQDGQLIGEMPPEFGFALALVWLGLLGALAGAAALGTIRLWRWQRGKKRRRGRERLPGAGSCPAKTSRVAPLTDRSNKP
ncbi:MAG: hypothetical protein WCO00_05305 [Rhodospirillaceae bacterium]